ncbi:tellurite resistance TerB family protein [Acanthopleuribacter pedis]|uniref:TerB family tellurite resistance protein n=1 Tax=Acanthopleuribacter pedis TaxID=442870 RepID=A0A8J7Q5T8_9BACT|nr:TerB family tellurite resistance protein [Acanthopleuribacter pedis]MBO1317179.1 TerB family tellurite resistance protein [Acanthopleuribacter pedis]
MSFFERVRLFFSSESKQEQQEDPLLYRVVLLLEVAMFDDEFDNREKALIVHLLETKYGLNREEIEALLTLADEKRAQSHDIFAHTSRINDWLSLEDRADLMKEIWQVIFADDKLTPQEDHLARRLRTLLRLDHQHWAQAKQDAREAGS